jgi:hypothetical protein
MMPLMHCYSFVYNSKTCQQRAEGKYSAKKRKKKKCCLVCKTFSDSQPPPPPSFEHEMVQPHKTAFPATAISQAVSSNGNRTTINTHNRSLFFMEPNESLKCNRDLPLIRNLVLADSSGSQTSQCDIVHQMDSVERIHCHKYRRAVTNTVWLIQVSTMIQQQLY